MTTNLNALRQERNKPNTLIRLIGSSTSSYKKRRTSVGNVVFSRVEHRKMREQANWITRISRFEFDAHSKNNFV
jgi:hypothetical protein